MVTFVKSYSYNRPFDGSHNVEVALSENEFDTPAIKPSKSLNQSQSSEGVDAVTSQYSVVG